MRIMHDRNVVFDTLAILLLCLTIYSPAMALIVRYVFSVRILLRRRRKTRKPYDVNTR